VADLSAADVGQRVSVRRRDPAITAGPSLRDAVGILESLDEHHLRIRLRDGSVVTVSRAEVVASRRVVAAASRLRRAGDVDTATLERLTTAGWPAVEVAPLGEWLLRASGGFTGRANSVLPLGDPGRPLDEACSGVIAWYRDRGLPPRFQVPLPLCAELDASLHERGWAGFDPVRVLVADVEAVRMAAERRVDLPPPVVSGQPDDRWMAVYHYRGQEQPPPIARRILAAGAQPVFVTIADDEGALAVARGAVDGQWLGVTAVEVSPRARRRRLGVAVMLDLVDAGRARGARFSYLQVADENTGARAMYDLLGYVEHHRYHYRAWQR
jgi:GNAT superfamily N-acetyltransferase